MNKKLFCEIINAIREQIEYDKDYCFALQELFKTENVVMYDHSRLVKSLMALLRLHFPVDSEGFCSLEHYMFYEDFGKYGEHYESVEDFYERLTD